MEHDKKQRKSIWQVNIGKIIDIRKFCQIIQPAIKAKREQLFYMKNYCCLALRRSKRPYTPIEISYVEKITLLNRKQKIKSFNSILQIQHSPISPLLIGWLAGIIDGEGTITLNYKKHDVYYAPLIIVNNTNIILMSQYCSILHSMGIKTFSKLRKCLKHTWSNIWYANIYKKSNINHLLKILLPYLSGKRPVAQLMLEFNKLRLYRDFDKKKDIYNQIAFLNKRGK